MIFIELVGRRLLPKLVPTLQLASGHLFPASRSSFKLVGISFIEKCAVAIHSSSIDGFHQIHIEIAIFRYLKRIREDKVENG